MRPEPRVQIRLGMAFAVLALLAVAIAAFVPDPFMKQRLFQTSLDNVDGVTTGVPVSFMGGQVGKVRWIRLDPRTNLYSLGVGLQRTWTPPRCSVVQVAASNPLTAPKVEIVAPSAGRTYPACATFRRESRCQVLSAPTGVDNRIDGCLRQGDLIQLATAALTQATSTIADGQTLVAKLNALVGGFGQGGPGKRGAGAIDLPKLARNVTETTASLNAIAGKVDATLSPQRQQDLGAVVGNVRTLTGKAAAFDVASVQQTVAKTNALLQQMTTLLEENRQNVQGLASQGAGLTAESREMLNGMQSQLVAATGNLERASDNLDALSERLRADPTYALRGAKFTDPPPPGRSK